MADRNAGAGASEDKGSGPASGPTEGRTPGTPTPLDQPTTPEQRAEMFAKDPPVEFDPLGQALVSGVGDLGKNLVVGPIFSGVSSAITGADTFIGGVGGSIEHAIEHFGAEAAAYVTSEAALYGADKTADASQGSQEGQGAVDEGTFDSGQGPGDQSTDESTSSDGEDQPVDEPAASPADATPPAPEDSGIGQVR